MISSRSQFHCLLSSQLSRKNLELFHVLCVCTRVCVCLCVCVCVHECMCVWDHSCEHREGWGPCSFHAGGSSLGSSRTASPFLGASRTLHPPHSALLLQHPVGPKETCCVCSAGGCHLSHFKRFNMSEIGLYLTTIIHNVFIAFLVVPIIMVHTWLTQLSTKYRNIC